MNLRSIFPLILTLLVSGLSSTAAAADNIDIPYTRFQLDNGLTVIVHEDHKAPIVAVAVWYHVGSADEPTGKTGFAHLYEHLMFEGSENHSGSYFKPFELVGATDQNGTTYFDRTNYFETVPTTALDMALWMESDRMGHLLNAIGQTELDKQRGVVQNEKRQRENQPYGHATEHLLAHTFPANHPYHHLPIGSMEDLNAAALADVKQWFKDYYGAANTTIVLAGDIDAKTAKEKVQKYFGDIAAGPPVPRLQPWVAPREHSTHTTIADNNAPQVRILRAWNIPQSGNEDENRLELAAYVLGGSKTSRLYQRLVYKDKLVDNAETVILSLSLASIFALQVDVKKDVDPTKVEAAIADEWKKFLEHGPTEEELERAKTVQHANFIRHLEKIGGNSGKATILAEGQVYRNDPTAYKKDFAIIDAATPKTVLATAKQWVSHGDHTLTIKPGKADTQKAKTVVAGLGVATGAPAPIMPAPQHYTTTKSDVDRSKGIPTVTQFPDLNFPTLQHGKLKNGIEVILAERHAIPVVQMQLLFDSGYAADQGRKLGTSSFTMGMFNEGTHDLDSVEISKRQERLGAEVSTACSLDSCSINMNALTSQLLPSLTLYADIVRNPAFRDADIARIRGQWLAGIAQEKTSPSSLANRVLPPLLYGDGHAYAIPFTGSGTEASIQSLNVDDMRTFVKDYVRPDNAKILIVGDTTLAAIVPLLDAAFSEWETPTSAIPKKNLATVTPPAKPRVYLMDRPGAPQSLIFAGVVAPSTKASNNLEIRTMNSAFGGVFSSRLNMNLRDTQHWSYGVWSALPDAMGQRPFLMTAPVQTDKTADSIQELLKEARDIIGSRPLSNEEIVKIKYSDVRSLPGDYESTGAVLGAIKAIVSYNRPDDYVQTTKRRIEAQQDTAVQAAAKEVIKPDALTWVIVGDLSKIEQPIRALNLGEVQVLNADGQVAKQTVKK